MLCIQSTVAEPTEHQPSSVRGPGGAIEQYFIRLREPSSQEMRADAIRRVGNIAVRGHHSGERAVMRLHESSVLQAVGVIQESILEKRADGAECTEVFPVLFA